MDSFPLERPYITITNVIWSFDYDTQQVKVLLIKRADEPFKNFWALPEILLREDESAHEASLRLIKENRVIAFGCSCRAISNVYSTR